MLCSRIAMSKTPSPRRPVLVVEDDEVLRVALRELLGGCGYTVYTASHGEEALEAIASMPEPPGVILLDLVMPVMDGWETMQRLREDAALAGIPVVVVSVFPPTGSARGKRSLAKPVELEPLVAAIEEYCGPARLPANAEAPHAG